MSKIYLEPTQNPQPRVYEGNPVISVFLLGDHERYIALGPA